MKPCAHLAVTATLLAGCVAMAPDDYTIVSEKLFKERVVRHYVSDPSFPLYTLYVGVALDTRGRVIAIRCTDAIDNRNNWTRSVKLDLPPRLLRVAAAYIATKGFKPQIANGRPEEFYVTFFYSPREPKLLEPGF